MWIAHRDHREESAAIVQEFLRRELVSAELTERVEQLCTEGNSDEALRLILEERRARPGETTHHSPDSAATE
jgi:hypothetical protein